MQKIDDLLDEREKTHGKFSDHAHISQRLKDIMIGYGSRSVSDGMYLHDYQREALEMIFHKIARILNGDSTHADHWIDIAGYAQLVARELEA